jgi:hypothetical protein
MKKLILIAALFTLGCSAEKRLARKEERTWDNYSTSPRLVARSVPLVKSLYPSFFEVVRTDTTFLPDSIPYTIFQDVPFEVLKYKDKVIDTLLGDYALYIDSLGVQIKYLGKPQIITKIIRTTKIDESEVNRLKDSLNIKEVAIANVKGKYSQLEKQLNETESDKNRWATYFWLLVAVIAILIGTALFFKFKPKIPLP